ncbi:hypothetical protein AAG570_001884 [Ranatra chinensis]|uniref:Uncharacterized protein n=1 Tax=Ranatra chinensis TaxID=642074 RepID=A0ABD0YBR0_9HEMI
MASKRRNMFYQNKKQETTEIVAGGTLSCSRLPPVGLTLTTFRRIRAFRNRAGKSAGEDIRFLNEKQPWIRQRVRPASMTRTSIPSTSTRFNVLPDRLYRKREPTLHTRMLKKRLRIKKKTTSV